MSQDQNSHNHGHHHHGPHCYHSNATGYKLFAAIVFNLILTVVQIIGGVVSGSLSLIADAMHNFSDVGALIIAYLAQKISGLPANKTMTFGYGRAEILGALINSTTLVLVGLYLLYEAWGKFLNPQPIDGWIVVIVAFVAFLVDMVTVWLTYEGAKTSINMRAALIHNLSDAMASLVVMISGVLIILYKIYWIDFVATALISVYILYHSYGLIKSCVRTLMQAVPPHINVEEVKKTLEGEEGVVDVHDIHIWEVHEEKVCFEAHVKTSFLNLKDVRAVKMKIRKILKDKFGITHSTLEFEASSLDCSQ